MTHAPVSASTTHAVPRVYVLNVDCLACMRMAAQDACLLCCQIEDAERQAGRLPSPQLTEGSAT
jgi:hypothetical protein